MMAITFLHIADLHLDSPFLGLQGLPKDIYKRIRESTFTSFFRLIQVAIEKQVDFVVISGDLFDSENRSLRAQARFRTAMEQLKEHKIEAYIIHGNHDHLGGNWPHFEWPSNVHVFSGDNVEMKSFEKKGEILARLYGFSYVKKAVEENKTSYYEKIAGADYHIGLLHGSMEGDNEHSRYAPFSLLELQKKGFDYWALGHIHKRQVLSEDPPIIYPGNIQGRHRKESGEKGGYLVTLSQAGATYSFISTADIVWESIHVDITQITSYNQLVDQCFVKLAELRRKQQDFLVTLEFTGTGALHDRLLEKGMSEDLLAVLNDGIEAENFTYIVAIKATSTPFINREKLKKESYFVGDLLTNIDRYHFDDVFAPLLNHSGSRKFLSSFSDEELAEILGEAESLLLHNIYKSTRG